MTSQAVVFGALTLNETFETDAVGRLRRTTATNPYGGLQNEVQFGYDPIGTNDRMTLLSHDQTYVRTTVPYRHGAPSTIQYPGGTTTVTQARATHGRLERGDVDGTQLAAPVTYATASAPARIDLGSARNMWREDT